MAAAAVEQNTPDSQAMEAATVDKSCKPGLDKAGNRRLSVKHSDMPDALLKNAIIFAGEAMDRYQLEIDVARHIKSRMDERHAPGPWHCIVGRKYGSYITHESGYFCYFYLGHLAVLLFKSKD